MRKPRVTNVEGPERLKALAHPLRMRLLGLLRLEGPGTASSFAKKLNESSGATSYHLRQLARHGFIEVDEELGTGREKWWKAAHDVTHWSMADFLDDPAVAAVADTMRRQILSAQAEFLNAYFEKEHEWGRDWVDAAALDDQWIYLDPAGLRALTSAIHTLIDEHDVGPDGGPDIERVAVLLQAFPTDGLPI
jgi:DNA-binding transcriptional ArsR family regulator